MLGEQAQQLQLRLPRQDQRRSDSHQQQVLHHVKRQRPMIKCGQRRRDGCPNRHEPTHKGGKTPSLAGEYSVHFALKKVWVRLAKIAFFKSKHSLILNDLRTKVWVRSVICHNRKISLPLTELTIG